MRIVLYDEGTSDALDIGEIARYLARLVTGSQVEQYGTPFPETLSAEALASYAARIAGTKTPGMTLKLQAPQEPFYGEIEFERKRLLGATRAFGVPYDGVLLQRILTDTLPAADRRLDTAHIVFTNRLFTTWDSGDRRYHVRTSVYGTPSIISTTGIVEAPAKPRGYYLLKQQYESMRKDLTGLKERFTGRFIDYDDERLTDVAKGLAAQAVAYALTGYPFCDDKGCRLFNAHWQEDLIYAQVNAPYEFCPRHTEMFGGTA